MFNEKIESLQEELIMLCEIRGEMDSETNKKIETKIANLIKEINVLEGLQTV